MRVFGWLLFLGGLAAALLGCGMSAVAPGTELLNYGLLNDKTNIVIVGAALMVCGAQLMRGPPVTPPPPVDSEIAARPIATVQTAPAEVKVEENPTAIINGILVSMALLVAGGLGFLAYLNNR